MEPPYSLQFFLNCTRGNPWNPRKLLLVFVHSLFFFQVSLRKNLLFNCLLCPQIFLLVNFLFDFYQFSLPFIPFKVITLLFNSLWGVHGLPKKGVHHLICLSIHVFFSRTKWPCSLRQILPVILLPFLFASKVSSYLVSFYFLSGQVRCMVHFIFCLLPGMHMEFTSWLTNESDSSFSPWSKRYLISIYSFVPTLTCHIVLPYYLPCTEETHEYCRSYQSISFDLKIRSWSTVYHLTWTVHWYIANQSCKVSFTLYFDFIVVIHSNELHGSLFAFTMSHNVILWYESMNCEIL